MKHFEFKLKSHMVFGEKSLQSLISFLEQNNYRRVSVIIDSNVEKAKYWWEFFQLASQKCDVKPYFKNSCMEPTYDYLDEIRNEFSADVDCMIGVGGGSTMDLAKAISVLATNNKPAIQYRGHGLIEKKGIPLILAPSTAGSGSEITPFAVFIDTEEKRKFGINSSLYLPVLTVVDPILTISCPKSVTIASGMDALTHTLESFVAKRHTDISRLFSREAFRLIYNNLLRVVADPENLEFRTNMSLGAYYAGVALFNSAAGPAGVLSYPIGTLFNVTHGLAGSVFLYPAVEFNIKHDYKGYEELYDLMESKGKKGDKNELFLKNFKSFCDGLQIPSKLNGFGVVKKDIPLMLQHLKPLWGAVEQNPVEMSEQDIEKILEQMID